VVEKALVGVAGKKILESSHLGRYTAIKFNDFGAIVAAAHAWHMILETTLWTLVVKNDWGIFF